MASSDPQHQSAADLEKSIESTLSKWRSCFDVVDASSIANRNSSFEEDRRACRSPDEYQSRLRSFRPETFFAKPLSLSPLVCAAFGWENTDVDILKCKHPKCNAVLCIAFHPGLNKQNYDNLTEKYLQMLSSCHTPKCPFRSYSGRWLKVMHRQCDHTDKARRSETKPKENIESENAQECLLRKTTQSLEESPRFYVPPFFLTLSKAFSCFEDYSNDGTITHTFVDEGASDNLSLLRAMFGKEPQLEIKLPVALMIHFRELLPNVELASESHYDMENAARLLSTFGWHIQKDSPKDNTGCIVQCNICLAQSWLSCRRNKDGREGPSKKRRRERMQDATLQLIDSHRVYCPYVKGFSFWSGHQTELPGWKVVVSNLVRCARSKKTTICAGPVSVLACLWGDEC